MISTPFNEISTNESPVQSPRKSKNQISPNILLPNFNLNLQKVSEEKKIFDKNQTNFWKLRNIQTIKESENSLIKGRINENLINKKIDKKNKNNLLDFDFLVGEILDKINLKNNLNTSKIKKEKKIGIKRRKKVKANKIDIPNLPANQKSKLINKIFINYFIFVAETKLKIYQETQNNFLENPSLGKLNEIISQEDNEKVKINRKEKDQVLEKNSTKNYKTKKNYLELSDEFFSEKSIEVSYHIYI
jgi:hypothetical protein